MEFWLFAGEAIDHQNTFDSNVFKEKMIPKVKMIKEFIKFGNLLNYYELKGL